MADQNPAGNSTLGGMGRVQVLVEVIEEFHRRWEGQRPPPHPGGQGRAGASDLLRRLVTNNPTNIVHNPRGRGLRSLSLPCPW